VTQLTDANAHAPKFSYDAVYRALCETFADSTMRCYALRFAQRCHGPIVDHQNVDSDKPAQHIAGVKCARSRNSASSTPSAPQRKPRSFCPNPLVRARTRFVRATQLILAPKHELLAAIRSNSRCK
jgi:hypothetical protein